MKVAVYLRVSTKGQGDDDRYGLPKQEAEVAAYIAREGHEVVGEFRDVGFSGATADRPALAEMLESEGFEAVIVPAWDRLARDTMLDGYLRYSLDRRGVKLLSATQENGIDPTSKLTQGILAAVAGYERHLIAQRLAGARKVKALQGGYAHGQPPYGTYAPGDGTLAVNKDELKVLNAMRKLRLQGHSLRVIAAMLNQKGHTSRQGGAWGPSGVAGALASIDRFDRVALGKVAP
jgi:site-specific DNA recombinase